MTGKILKVARLGHPILEQKAQNVVDPRSPEIQTIINDMKATLEHEGGIGLAAPQVHIPLRIFIYFIPKETNNPKYDLTQEYDPEGVPLRVLINPLIEPISDEVILGWEGCLSVPGLLGEVERYKSVKVISQSTTGETLTIEAHGFHARALQHEYDHLEGLLFPKKIKNLSRFGYTEEVVQYLKNRSFSL